MRSKKRKQLSSPPVANLPQWLGLGLDEAEQRESESKAHTDGKSPVVESSLLPPLVCMRRKLESGPAGKHASPQL